MDPVPATHDNCCLLLYLLMHFDSLYEGLDGGGGGGGLVFIIHKKFSPLFISIKFWVTHYNKTNYSLKVRKVAKKSDN